MLLHCDLTSTFYRQGMMDSGEHRSEAVELDDAGTVIPSPEV